MCELCGGRMHYVARWDSYACLKCDTWMEAECECSEEEQCGFKGRPARPSDVSLVPCPKCGADDCVEVGTCER